MTAFATVAEIKAYGGVETAADDALLTRLADAVTELMEGLMSRSIMRANYSEVRHGRDNRSLMLFQSPVTAVQSVSINGLTIPARQIVTGAGYSFDEFTVYLSNDFVFTRGVNNIAISYTAGYESVPADIKQACVDSVVLIYKRKDRIGINSKSMAGETTSFQRTDLSDLARRVVDRYSTANLG